ncbi:MAG: WD40/YVTN/BNR-like repeat-containing protein [Hyalangium sp.]|uniref:WD40/YVTN/BNR-like repeat-containing protein n=1 Tax=Hyalangium sp. TaxID=2028555 RepID=UPI00389B2FDA
MKTPPTPCWRLLLVLLTLRALPALAHGGLPETSNLSLRRGSSEDFISGSTFGAVISRDHGQTWRWLCPEGMGIGAWRPERYFWLTGGPLLAATGSALIRSSDGACTWNTHPFFKDTWVTNLAVHPTDERIMYATTGKPSVANGIFRSEDGGETWTAVTVLSLDVRYSAIRIAPSDPQRIYASGQDSAGMMFFDRSNDGGQTWTRLPQPLPQFQRPYDLNLLLVSDILPEVVWARVSAQGFSYLLKSTDGGATLTQAMQTADVIVGAEASADGRTVWVSTPVHMYRGRGDEPFAELPLPNGNACALRVGALLYGCGSNWVHDWALGLSHDEGTTWEPIVGLSSIQGSHVCPAGTPVQELCPSRWPQLAAILGAPTYGDGGVDSPPDAGTSDPGEPLPPPKKGCSATTGLVPAAILLLTLTLGRRSRRGPSPRT